MWLIYIDTAQSMVMWEKQCHLWCELSKWKAGSQLQVILLELYYLLTLSYHTQTTSCLKLPQCLLHKWNWMLQWHTQQPLNICHSAYATQHMPLSICHSAYATQHMPLNIGQHMSACPVATHAICHVASQLITQPLSMCPRMSCTQSACQPFCPH